MSKKGTKIEVSTPALLAHFTGNPELFGIVGAPPNRAKVVGCLLQKAMTLQASVSRLNTALLSVTDPMQYNSVSSEIAAAQAERYVCSARASAINASQPFNDPGHAAEAALLLAVNNVNNALATTSALATLVAAVSGLVSAYPASST